MPPTKTIQIPASLHADILLLKDREGLKLHLNKLTIVGYLTRLIEQQKEAE